VLRLNASGCIMIISRNEAINMLKNEQNLLRDENDIEQEVIAEIVDTLVNPASIIPGRENGKKGRIPPIFREMIAIQANMEGNAAAVARGFGISRMHASVLEKGTVHQPHQIARNGLKESDIALATALEASLSKVRDKALDKIYASMDAISDEDLPNQQPKILAMIAANLSRVVSSTLRDKKDGPIVNVQTVFYSPEKQAKEQYDVIDVG
jgi:hypothetical protein